jgi:hypothetical protein
MSLVHRSLLVLGFLGAATIAAGPARAACSTAICVGGDPCTISGTNTIDNACVLNFGNKEVIVAKGAKLTTAATGHSYELQSRDLRVRGELEAIGGGITATLGGFFLVENFNTSAAAVDAHSGGSIDVTAGGNVTLTGKQFDVSGSGGIDGGSVTIDAGGAVTVAQTIDASGGGTFSFGGSIDITGASIATSATMRTNGASGGDGGDIDLTATGLCDVDGTLNLNGDGADSWGGFVFLDCGSVDTTSSWTANGGSFGAGGDIDVWSTGTVATSSSSSWSCTASGGGDGCFVTVSAGDDVALDGDINASASGADAFGGSIDVSSDAGDVSIGSTALFQADVGSNGAFNGDISVGGCNVGIDGTLDTRTTGGPSGGTNTVTYRTTFGGTAATLRAGDPTGNEIQCRCVDADANLVCDTPLTCVSAPNTTGGTYQPTPVITKVALPSC